MILQHPPGREDGESLLLNMVLFAELVGVAETDGVADTVNDPVSVLEAVASFPVPETEGVAEASSLPAVEEMVADSVAVAMSAVVLASSCRGIGRRTPAKATFRHRNRARRAHIR